MTLDIGDNSDERLSFDNVSDFDSTFFSTVSTGGRVYSVHYKVEGWYAAFVQFNWTTSFATGNRSIHMLNTGDTLSGETQTDPNDSGGLHVGPYPSFRSIRYWPDELDSLPGAPEFWVAQNSGSTRRINQAFWQSVYLGPGDVPVPP